MTETNKPPAFAIASIIVAIIGSCIGIALTIALTDRNSFRFLGGLVFGAAALLLGLVLAGVSLYRREHPSWLAEVAVLICFLIPFIVFIARPK